MWVNKRIFTFSQTIPFTNATSKASQTSKINLQVLNKVVKELLGNNLSVIKNTVSFWSMTYTTKQYTPCKDTRETRYHFKYRMSNEWDMIWESRLLPVVDSCDQSWVKLTSDLMDFIYISSHQSCLRFPAMNHELVSGGYAAYCCSRVNFSVVWRNIFTVYLTSLTLRWFYHHPVFIYTGSWKNWKALK